MWLVYSFFYCGALLYEYIMKSITFALSKLILRISNDCYKKINSIDDKKYVISKVHQVINFIYFRNFLINYFFFMTTWNIFLHDLEMAWNLFAYPIASLFFLLIGLGVIYGEITDTIVLYAYILFFPFCIVFLSSLLIGFPLGVWSINTTLIPLIIFKLFYSLYYEAELKYYEKNSYYKETISYKKQTEEEREEYLRAIRPKFTSLNFGWFSIPFVLFGLYANIYIIINFVFGLKNLSISWITLYIIFIVGFRSSGGILSLFALATATMESNKMSFFKYLLFYTLGATTDEVGVDLWLKKVILHSINATFIFCIIAKIYESF